MEDIDEAANTKLSLGLSINGGYVPLKRKQIEENKPMLPEEELMSLRRIDEGNYQYPDHKSGCRKKLRLTKEQSAMLEDSFKLHSSLNPVQKQALAQQLNLNPRQVEVWFQNRRARSKLKQTEVDCEILKKCCENLMDENRRLKKELEELRLLKAREAASSSSPLFIQLSRMATSLASCSSCEKQLKKAINIEGKNNNINDAISEVVRNKSHILQSSGIEI